MRKAGEFQAGDRIRIGLLTYAVLSKDFDIFGTRVVLQVNPVELKTEAVTWYLPADEELEAI